MQHEIPDYPEQDESGGDGLPTYDDLAAQKGPNSRFGRWKSWVEKRAAERFVDLTPEERARRRARGWGNPLFNEVNARNAETTQDVRTPRPDQQTYLQPSAPASVYSQDSQWSGYTGSQIPNNEPPSYYPSQPEPPVTHAGEPLLPSHLKAHQFGSRFLPHTTFPMNTLLPLMGDRLLLIGHDNGLSVLDMFPSGDPETSSPADAQIRHIWEGEGAYQLELLEFQDTGDLTPHGVVLALVGSEVESPTNSKENDIVRSIRMYNLSSLTSLARWATSQKNAKPIDLRRPPHWVPQAATTKKHKHSLSGINILKSIKQDGQNGPEPQSPQYSTPKRSNVAASNMKRHESASSVESSWDVVDELPLRWATDFVPLASAGSRLLHTDVLFFELFRGEPENPRGPTSLAIATKQSVLLYETPKGERAFRFCKEFYTPLQPRKMSFVHQKAQETVILRSPSDSSQRSQKSSLYSPDADSINKRFSSLRQSLDITRDRPLSLSPVPDYGAQLSLFVVFDKKAGLIRLADASVGEVELNDDSPRDSLLSPVGHSPRRSFIRESKGLWLPPTYEELPLTYANDLCVRPVYVLTRGKQTHIIPAPMPTPLSTCQPLYVLTWQHTPTQLRHRVCSPLDDPAFLQVIGFGEYGVEVQEIPLSAFTKGKGKGRAQDPVRAAMDLGGDVSFLFRGGQWHEPRRFLSRSASFMSCSSGTSTVHTGGLRKSAEDGFYASCRKGLEDWRVFWLGGEEKDDYSSSLDI
ncbi:hypothetical protein A7U60_g5449 [Sanghuangporus baumii]|uniref:Uncharacterized protein n=1 Tax=Sanghuangporus baumii TaxID=108892 RepID=A0A9Q5NBJ0_SANBA|nr:hypothetical protein A7U60_g5449 [Sanghuangporus baumii]